PLGRWTSPPSSAGPGTDKAPSAPGKKGKPRREIRPEAPVRAPVLVVARRLIKEKFPLFILAAAAAVIVYIVQLRSGVLHADPFPLPWRVENALVSYVAYLGQTFWPVDLSIFYPHPLGTVPLWWSAGAALLLTAVTGGCIVLRHKAPYLITGWFWYLITLIPVIGLVQVGVQARADRYTYLPLIGIFIMVAWGLGDLIARRPRLREPLVVLAAVVLVALSVVTYGQVAYWRNAETLYRRAIEAVPNNYWAYNNLGAIIASAGRIEEAKALFQRSLAILPDYPGANKNMAVALYHEGRYDAALPYVERALRIQPGNPELHLINGLIQMKMGRRDDAAASFREALRLRPGYPDAQAALAELTGPP
ncbi:MAG: tetratricopeptide repeat protein, partial [Syntrophales bacterium]|nr:tetratricopeptide repeat protein [Syntrophales bacterium]